VGLTIGVDVGGTKVLGGVVDASGEVLAQARRVTPADDTAKTVGMIAEVILELAGTGRPGRPAVDAVGIGAAGWIDAERSIVQFAPNLAWRNEPLRDDIANQVGLPVVVENDANAAAWAEFEFGAGSDANDSMVLFTVGTGIGGGIILGGRLVRGANGIAGELGHTVSVPDGHLCGCGRYGCLEQYASGSALVRFARDHVRMGRRRPRDRCLDHWWRRFARRPHEVRPLRADDPLPERRRRFELGQRRLLDLHAVGLGRTPDPHRHRP